MKQEFKCFLEERTSKKGTTYQCIVIKLTDRLEKLVFLTDAELELLKMNNKSANPFVK